MNGAREARPEAPSAHDPTNQAVLRGMLVLPFAYFLRSRLPTTRRRVGWLLGYLLPVLVLSVASERTGMALVEALLMVTAVYAAYGYGYLVNDTVAIHREQRPTLRATTSERAWLRERLRAAFVARAVIGTACLVALIAMQGSRSTPAVLGWVALWLVFALYNRLRGRVTILLYFMLVSLRYCLPILAASSDPQLLPLVPVLLLYAVPNTYEAAWKQRYGLAVLKRPFHHAHRFRIVWSATVAVAALAYAAALGTGAAWLFAGVSVYYLLFRVGAFGLRHLGTGGEGT